MSPLREAVDQLLADEDAVSEAWGHRAYEVLAMAVHMEDGCPVYRSDCPLCQAYLAASTRHGGQGMSYPVLGETDVMSGGLAATISTYYAMLPQAEVWAAIRRLRAANDLYTELLNAQVEAEAAADTTAQ